MNAPDITLLAQAHKAHCASTLANLSICYAPLIDRERKAIGTRLTLLSARGAARPPVGQVLDALNCLWPEQSAQVLVAPLDALIDESVRTWQPPRNVILEIPAAYLQDPAVQTTVQILFRDGKRLALRGRAAVPPPPALLCCFEYSLIHISEDRRVQSGGRPLPAAAGNGRQLPFIITGVQTVADLDAAFERGATASVGWPIDDVQHRCVRPLQPGQAVVMELLRLVRDDADITRIDAAIKRDPALAFKLLRLVNSAAFGLPVQITGFQHAVMMLGYKKMMRWLSLLLATAGKDANTFPLMRASIRRGLFLENIGGEDTAPEVRDELFITGAFSMLDRITGAPFEKLFELISLSDNVTDAVMRRQGPYAAYLSLIESIERSDPVNLARHLDSLALSVAACNSALLKALAAANTLDSDL